MIDLQAGLGAVAGVVVATVIAAPVGIQIGKARGAADERIRCERVIGEANQLVDRARREVSAQAAAIAEDVRRAKDQADSAADELRAEIERTADADRVALRARIAGLLNDRNRDRAAIAAARSAAGRADAPDSAAAANPGGPGAGDEAEGGTSEAALAGWIVTAQRLYKHCRTVATGLQEYARACASRGVGPIGGDGRTP